MDTNTRPPSPTLPLSLAVDEGQGQENAWVHEAKESEQPQTGSEGDLVLATHLGQEVEEGNTEYKLKLVDPSDERVQHLITQLNWRLNEGSNEAVYEIGVQDDGTPAGLSDEDLRKSLETLQTMCNALNSTMQVRAVLQGTYGKVAEVYIRRRVCQQVAPIEIRVSVVGNVDSGKSTLVGVLVKGVLDNGRGLARMQVFRYNHEIESGRTSSISYRSLGFNASGEILNNTAEARRLSSAELLQESSKLISFIDLAGSEKYLKTTTAGMVGRSPEYCMLTVGANQGVQRMTGEHLGIALALEVPLFVVLTKVDIAPKAKLQGAIQTLDRIITGANKTMTIVRSHDDILRVMGSTADDISETFPCKNEVPVFEISNVTGEGLDFLKTFLLLLPSRTKWAEAATQETEVQLEDCFQIEGVGTVLAGLVRSGAVSNGDRLLYGPDKDGIFTTVTVLSVHVNRVAVHHAVAGQCATFAVRTPKKCPADLLRKRKGAVLLSPQANAEASFEFDAEVLVLHHPNHITVNYQPVVHVRCISQTVRILAMSTEELRTGDRAVCRFRFMYHPEFIRPGSPILFREGRTRGVGRIIQVHPQCLSPVSLA